MEKKICSRCHEEKLIGEYYTKGKKKTPHSMCKNCFNLYCVERWTQRKIDAIVYKGSKCTDCEINYPEQPYVIFDFHHREPSIKDFDWSKLRLRAIEDIKIELDKCDLLCSNCHRKRHYQENL
jgi:hypothetical protein